jgi:hypothetical protein
MARWLVDLVGKRVTRLGTVQANTERDAIDAVTKRFGIESVRRSYKVVVTKVETNFRIKSPTIRRSGSDSFGG